MVAEGRFDPREVTVRLGRDDLRLLVRRATDAGMTPEAFVERLTRDAYGRALAPSRPEPERVDPTR